MKTIEIGAKTYKVAENWHELTSEQYKNLIACPRLKSKEYRTVDNEAAACYAWLGMGAQGWHDLVLAPWQWGQLRNQCAWLFDTSPTGKPPLDVFVHKGINYHLPADNFANATAIEIAYANMTYLAFAHPDSPDQLALDQLVAILCRPRRVDLKKFQHSKEWNGDIRAEFTEQRMNEAATAFADLDVQIKLVVLDYFERMNNEFLTQYGELFGQNGRAEVRYGDGRGWIMLLKNVAKEGHFGDFDKVCQQPAHLFFATLLDDMLDAQAANDAKPTNTDENY